MSPASGSAERYPMLSSECSRALPSCRRCSCKPQTSQRFRKLLRDSLSLQYKIELALDGLEDGEPGGLPIIKRIQALRHRRQCWRTFDFSFQRVITVPERRQYTYAGTHFAWFNAEGVLQVLQIPSQVKGVPEKLFTVPVDVDATRVVDMLADPGSDLLVLIVM